MPFRLDEFRAKVQFTTSAQMPSLIFEACKATGIVSNTRYLQLAVIDALVRDLGLDRDLLIAALPAARGPAAHLYDPAENTMSRYGRPVSAIGPIEDVR